ncbi:MAG: hypothetical protein M1118_12770 [Chloroflexi bacterium]|nr:hypothetical protein [Chloroflexota bacterium]
MDAEDYAQFGQLILLEHVRAGRLALAGALSSIPVAALVVGVGMVTEHPAADNIALAIVLLITGAIGAKAYQRAQLRWRRGDLTAAAVWWLVVCGSLAVAVSRPISDLLPLAFVGLPLWHCSPRWRGAFASGLLYGVFLAPHWNGLSTSPCVSTTRMIGVRTNSAS